jgi:hypothetical protein
MMHGKLSAGWSSSMCGGYYTRWIYGRFEELEEQSFRSKLQE